MLLCPLPPDAPIIANGFIHVVGVVVLVFCVCVLCDSISCEMGIGLNVYGFSVRLLTRSTHRTCLPRAATAQTPRASRILHHKHTTSSSWRVIASANVRLSYSCACVSSCFFFFTYVSSEVVGWSFFFCCWGAVIRFHWEVVHTFNIIPSSSAECAQRSRGASASLQKCAPQRTAL